MSESFVELVRQGIEVSQKVATANASNPQWELVDVPEPVVGVDAGGLVEVTIRNYRVSRVRLDHLWFPEAELEEMEARLAEAFNDGLMKFFARQMETEQELAEAMGSGGLQELSERLSGAFDQLVDELRGRVG
ncbi:hypothetical protein HMPREF1531_01210 [Propionibacterium sp. oral taxon 192 str. F0372]|uniref:YbaB/EbfC family nucleoid-associated protein n=1 Tax=Propionibacterium sp. oral taxon 192 TaxID=671222 RepID=UPI0003535562|nr:YbaB/EbfC family nucleoid-associated protein [Propionibacterium sp. oral taxon 192]EPH03784.1 hypothetical protein HMPREF1531_01210 [Propionibacterium sp. oral taxon 192 str. F0372]